jgi:transposase-like protein
MTSRTNRHSEDRNLGSLDEGAPTDHEKRRQLAVERYLDGDPIEVICQEMGCSTSWLYKWKTRYQATDPTWFRELSRCPATTPTKTPEAIEAEIIALRQALSPDGSATASARVIRDHLRYHPSASIPSLRTIYRILNRQPQEGASPSATPLNRIDPLTPRHMTP